jgi:hypothetical protein
MHWQTSSRITRLARCCFVAGILVIAMLLWSPRALARTAPAKVPGISLAVSIGFNSSPYNSYRLGKWTPIQVEMTNHGSAFRGELSASTQTEMPDGTTSGDTSPWQFETPVTLSAASQQHVTLYVPFYDDTALSPGVIVRLLNTQGKVVATQTATSQLEVRPGNLQIGLLSNVVNGFSTLNAVSLPNQTSLVFVNLNANTLPDSASVLDNFDIIIVDDFDSQVLSSRQLLALETWVNNGGILVESAGAQWQQTLAPLPSQLVPVNLDTTAALPPGTQLISHNDPAFQLSDPQSLTSPLPVSTDLAIATIHEQPSLSNIETVLSTGTVPLLVQAHEGQGTICYLAVDMADLGLSHWRGLYDLWTNTLMHAMGDQSLVSGISESYSTGPGQVLTRMGLLDMLQPVTLPGPLILLLLVIGYAIMLGPGRLLLARKFRQPHIWRWRIFVSSIFIFSLFAYSLAAYQRTESITDNSITLVEMNQAGNSAHITTYAGIYVPSQGEFTLHIPGQSLAQPIANEFLSGDGDIQSKETTNATMSVNNTETTMSLHGLSPWTPHYTIMEQDRQFSGGLTANVSLSQNKLIGTLKNSLPTAFNDVSILLPDSVAFIGHIGAGETIHINAPLYSSAKQGGQTLADVIQQHNGLPASYFPYTSNNQPQTDLQRHMALLSALEGVGYNFAPCQGPCSMHAVVDRDTIFITGGRVPNPNMNTYEPLLLNNAPATLIGWTSQPLTSNITINGLHPRSHQDTFVQMPLNVNVANAASVPPNILPGQLVNLQSYDAEQTLTGIYTMTYGSMIFEMDLPDLTRPLTHGLTIYQPDLWANPFGPGSTVNSSHMLSQLYNWQKGKWDTVTFKNDSYHTNNLQDYVGPSGRVLLQVSNQNQNLGNKLYFGKPSLII